MKFIINWFRDMYHRYKLKKKLKQFKKNDPFIYK